VKSLFAGQEIAPETLFTSAALPVTFLPSLLTRPGDSMFCSKCGNSIAPNNAFCQVCGSPAQSTAVPASVPATHLQTQPAPASAMSPASVSPHWLPTPTRQYAGFWLRFVAHLIDGFITGIALMALLVPIALLGGLGAAVRGIHPDAPPDPAVFLAFGSTIALMVVGSLVGGWLYNAYFESSDWQATVGKKVMNLVVTDLQGNRLSFGRASGRFFAKIVSGLIPFGIGYILAGITEKKQALHDMIAGCLVFRN
jgi:uncharacterized RDD family membrane protein YckC